MGERISITTAKDLLAEGVVKSLAKEGRRPRIFRNEARGVGDFPFVATVSPRDEEAYPGEEWANECMTAPLTDSQAKKLRDLIDQVTV